MKQVRTHRHYQDMCSRTDRQPELKQLDPLKSDECVYGALSYHLSGARRTRVAPQSLTGIRATACAAIPAIPECSLRALSRGSGGQPLAREVAMESAADRPEDCSNRPEDTAQDKAMDLDAGMASGGQPLAKDEDQSAVEELACWIENFPNPLFAHPRSGRPSSSPA